MSTIIFGSYNPNVLAIRTAGALVLATSIALLLYVFWPSPRYADSELIVPLPELGRTVHLSFDAPQRLRSGERDSIRLSLRMEEDASPGTGYNVLAVVHLDGAGLRFDPPGDAAQSIRPGDLIEWQWDIRGEGEARLHKLNVIIRLQLVPRAGGEMIERAIWARTLTIERVGVFGMDLSTARAIGIAGGLMGSLVLAFAYTRSSR